MLVKVIIIAFIGSIIYSLATGLFYLVRDKKNDEAKLAKALTWRIGLSLVLFFLILTAFALGWIKPHGI